MRKRIITVSTFVLALLLGSPQARCATTNDGELLVGHTVTVISQVAWFKADGRIIGRAELGDNVVVDEVKGDLIFVKSRGGYIERADVVAYQDAIDFFTQQIKEYPSAIAFDSRARIWFKRGALKLAIDDFTSAVQVDSRHHESYVGRGVVYEANCEYDKAVADFDKALEVDPTLAYALSNRGIVRCKRGEYIKGIDDFKEAIRLNPLNALSYNNVGRALCDIRAFDAAIPYFNQAIRLDPSLAIAFSNRGSAWLEKAEYDRAYEDIDKAIQLDPRAARLYLYRARVWLAKGESEKAIADYERLAQLDPAVGKNSLAWLRSTSPNPKLRNGKQAVLDATKACELTDWKDDVYIDTLSAALAEDGRYNEAIQRLQQAITMNPNYETESRAKMMAAFKSGNPFHQDETRPKPAAHKSLDSKTSAAKFKQ